MPKFTVERSHQHGVEGVKQRLQQLSDKLADKYGLTSQWKSATEAEVKGKGATGKITCTADKVAISIDLPFMLAPLKGKIEEKVSNELDLALA